MFILLGKTVQIDGSEGENFRFELCWKNIFLSPQSWEELVAMPESFQSHKTVFVFEVYFPSRRRANDCSILSADYRSLATDSNNVKGHPLERIQRMFVSWSIIHGSSSICIDELTAWSLVSPSRECNGIIPSLFTRLWRKPAAVTRKQNALSDQRSSRDFQARSFCFSRVSDVLFLMTLTSRKREDVHRSFEINPSK